MHYQCNVMDNVTLLIYLFILKKSYFFQRHFYSLCKWSFFQKYASSVNKDITLCYDLPVLS